MKPFVSSKRCPKLSEHTTFFVKLNLPKSVFSIENGDLLDTARKVNLKLNKNKLNLRCKEVPYIGDLLTKDGLKPDPKKDRAIQDMPRPTDVTLDSYFLIDIIVLKNWEIFDKFLDVLKRVFLL
jgi:hypothetical protein